MGQPTGTWVPSGHTKPAGQVSCVGDELIMGQ